MNTTGGDKLRGEYGYKDGRQIIGAGLDYYESGVLAAKVMFKNGRYRGLYEEYHENGVLKARVRFGDGLEVGEARHYYANGKLEAEGGSLSVVGSCVPKNTTNRVS